MPELPEVETVVRTLEKQIANDVITALEIRYPKVIATDPDQFQEILGKQILAYKRRGKYLQFMLSDDYILYVHLRMEGKFYIYENSEDTYSKHIHLVMKLQSGKYLCYHDTRKFGRFYLVKQGTSLQEIDKLGYEPFQEELTPKILYTMCHNSKEDLKTFLLNQEHICGIGNIYANEVCYHMQLHPRYKVNKLTQKECHDLLHYIRIILNEAIQHGGTTIRSYTSSLGVTGLFQLQVKVHGKENEECVACGTLIKKIMLHQRGTYYCPNCQRRGSRS
ncbi:MAG: DNA-formamidopyrimidine glycosylase [Erysipelotrichaceae bacterium]|nr:DNA-formamidopyrimidine glycosylase [Erysipelotrichaceae bacterium]